MIAKPDIKVADILTFITYYIVYIFLIFAKIDFWKFIAPLNLKNVKKKVKESE